MLVWEYHYKKLNIEFTYLRSTNVYLWKRDFEQKSSSKHDN